MVELKSFIDNLKTISGRPVHQGTEDFGTDQYPAIQVLVDNSMIIDIKTTKALTLDIPVTVKIIVDKERDSQALELLEKILKKINQFNDQQGNQIDETITPEYTDNTFEISFIYSIKKIILDT